MAGAAAGAGDAAGAAGGAEVLAGTGFDCTVAADDGASTDTEEVKVSSGSGCAAGRRVDEVVGFGWDCIVAHPDVGETFAEISFICIFHPQIPESIHCLSARIAFEFSPFLRISRKLWSC